jgi:two-component system CheB/CheR fusion protein
MPTRTRPPAKPSDGPAPPAHRRSAADPLDPPDHDPLGSRGPHGPTDGAGVVVVGIAAAESDAGSLRELLAAAPPSDGFAYVVLAQPAPGPRTRLAAQFAPHTPLEVVEVDGPVRMEPAHVYLVPAGAEVAVTAGRLELSNGPDGAHAAAADGPPSWRPFDRFFAALARDLGSRAAAVLLAGYDDDGAQGLADLKSRAGTILVQDLRMRQLDHTPERELLAELADAVLPAAQLLPHLAAQQQPRPSSRALAEAELPAAFQEIFALLRSRSRHDFSAYKRSTIRRRIERRIAHHQLAGADAYVRYLQQHAEEIDALFRELLIGVTAFFRDPEAFEALAGVLDELVRERPLDHVLRAWVPGCSTGEEAYTLAILLRESLDRQKRHMAVQIFATDIDLDAINVARSGVYPASIAADVSPERLERFFAREDDSYRIRKDIRETLIFAPQNMIADPPFTKLDVLSCRNLLIYLDGRLQVRLLPVFHYALRRGGVLFLGSSESVGNFSHLFSVVDKKAKLFLRKEVVGSSGYPTEVTAGVPSDLPAFEAAPAPARKRPEVNVGALSDRLLLTHLVPPSVIVHERGDIVHIHGRTGQFLEPAPGPQGTANLFTMAREGLQLELTSAIRQASGSDGEVVRSGLRVREGASFVSFDLRVRRLAEPDAVRGLFLVSFDRTQRLLPGEEERRGGNGAHGERVAELERELQYTKESHQSMVEELETANEELKSTNEELQSTNEEMQSTNEEMETSKEEMQSLNEELATVNAELQAKVEELSRANDDMKNLLNGTDIATIFLDNDLNIKRFTDRARKVIKLIPSDVGRPLADLVSKLRYPRLIDDALEVVHNLVFREIEVEAFDGCWYLVRLVPYRTTENVIDGLVMTFTEVTKVKGLQEQQRRIFRALESSATSVSAQDLDLRYLWAFGPVLGTPSADAIGKTDVELVGAEEGAAIAELKRRVISSGRTLRERVIVTVRGRKLAQDVLVAPLSDGAHELIGITCISTESGTG